jgi:hypothetical protein
VRALKIVRPIRKSNAASIVAPAAESTLAAARPRSVSPIASLRRSSLSTSRCPVAPSDGAGERLVIPTTDGAVTAKLGSLTPFRHVDHANHRRSVVLAGMRAERFDIECVVHANGCRNGLLVR